MHFALSSSTSSSSAGTTTTSTTSSATGGGNAGSGVKPSASLANYTLLHMSIEQLFTDQEIAGQCRAIKTLVNCATQGK
jgi:hypothetical protein